MHIRLSNYRLDFREKPLLKVLSAKKSIQKLKLVVD